MPVQQQYHRLPTMSLRPMTTPGILRSSFERSSSSMIRRRAGDQGCAVLHQQPDVGRMPSTSLSGLAQHGPASGLIARRAAATPVVVVHRCD
jgi:hypothetical protein